MKPLPSIRPFHQFIALLLVAVLAAGPGCGGKTGSAPSSGSIKSAEPTTFAEVTAKLDAGGNLYGYLGTAQWLSGLSAKLEPWRDAMLGFPDMPDSDRATVRQLFDTAGRLIRNSGLESVTGVGMSGIAIQPGLYQTKLFFHHPAGQDQGYLWKFFGGDPARIAELDWLPATTAWVTFSDLDLAAIWTTLRTEVRAIPALAKDFDEGLSEVQQELGFDLDKILASLSGRVGIFLTLDAAKQISLPLPTPEPLQIPTPAFAIALRVKDNTLFDLVVNKLKENPGISEHLEQSDAGGLKRTTVVLPPSIPVPLRPTIARHGDYLFIATTDALLNEMLEVQAGKRPGLRAGAEFTRLSSGMPANANQFSFVSDQLSGVMQKLQQTWLGMAGESKAAPVELMKKLQTMGGPVASYSIAQNLPDGRLVTVHGHQQPANAVLLPLVVAPVAVMAGMLLPALSKAKGRAQSISCVNNLKQIGLAARIFAVDHEDNFPPSFLAMTNELVSPRVLICPQDPGAASAAGATWSNWDVSRSSYVYVAPGLKEGKVDPQTVVFRCRVHGHEGLADGSVRQAPGAR